ncbi:hypothetical protein Nepgr_027750 [Nepenthes gracilis]|uniref:Uncharacterized protein n=1 Tax=Nepenthes gracilis TaxID=150966 RepID=A0AAD3TCA3_NEPGR|nr:hypothetical protein Nepgr_027750 [Nepenthes gracilis]
MEGTDVHGYQQATFPAAAPKAEPSPTTAAAASINNMNVLSPRAAHCNLAKNMALEKRQLQGLLPYSHSRLPIQNQRPQPVQKTTCLHEHFSTNIGSETTISWAVEFRLHQRTVRLPRPASSATEVDAAAKKAAVWRSHHKHGCSANLYTWIHKANLDDSNRDPSHSQSQQGSITIKKQHI